MKKYSVYVEYTDGRDTRFETNTNVELAQPRSINGVEFIVTEEENINLLDVKEIDIVRLK